MYIETATAPCSVALSDDWQIIFDKTYREGSRQASVLAPMVGDALAVADSRGVSVSHVALSMGPGSYTGLRVGASMAKGVCYGRGARLIAVPTLKLLTVPLLLCRDDIEDDTLFCPMIDARRMEVYTAVYDRALKEIRPPAAVIVEQGAFGRLLDSRKVCFFGNGADKCEAVINHPNARFIKGIIPEARCMMPLARQAVVNGKFEDIAYFEPFYLKDFIATTPKKLF